MIFKTIEIHNIKSIEDATVNFDKAPLNNASIFLISGPTGVGKSTILDAICLALYRKTPSTEGAGNESYDAANDNNLSLNSIQQVLRNGSSEGFVKLTFTGNDNLDYCARWSVRINNRGNLKEEWSLSCIGGDTWEKNTEIEFRIIGKQKKDNDDTVADFTPLVGMDFSNFRKTTLLAQGDFAEFLKCPAKDKAQILEKITDQHIYSKIGKYIFDHHKELKDELVVLNARLEGKHRLSQEDLDALMEAWQNCKQEIENKSNEQSEIQKKAEWLKGYQEAKQNFELCKNKLGALQQKLSSESFQVEENVISQWKDSSVARVGLASLHQLSDSLQNKMNNLEAYQGRFGKLQGTIGAEQQYNAEQSRTLKQVEAKLVQYTDQQKNMFDQAQTIIAQLNQARKYHNESDNALNKVADIKKKLPDLLHQAEDADARYNEQNSKMSALQQAINAADKLIKEIDPDGNLQHRAAALSQVDANLNVVKSAMGDYAKNNSLVEDFQRKIETSKQKIKDLTAAQSKAQSDFDKAKNFYDNIHLSVEDATKRLRQKLVVGCNCPVCGQIVNQLQDNAMFDAALEKPKKEFDAAQDLLNAANTDLSAEMKNLNETLTPTLWDAHQQKERAETRLKESVNDLLALYPQTPLSAPSSLQTEQDIDAEIERVKNSAQIVSGLLDKLKDSLNKKNEVQSKKNAQQQIVNELKEKSSKASQTVTDAEKDKASALELAEKNAQDETDILSSLDAVIAISDWRKAYEVNSGDLCEEINSQASTYKKEDETRQALSDKVQKSEEQLEEAMKAMNEILDLDNKTSQTRWSNVVVPDENFEHSDRLSEAAHKLLKDILLWNSEICSVEDRIKTCNNDLKSFFETHPDLSKEQLEALSKKYSDDSIKQLDESHEKSHSDLKSLEGSLSTLQNALESTLQNKPASLTDEDEQMGVAVLTDKSESLKQNIAELNKKSGEYKAKKEANDEVIINSAALQNEIDDKQKNCDLWSRLDTMLGSADGAKFNRIAQGFVLNVLLAKSNYYLSQFDEDFELFSQDNSLVILVKNKRNNAILSPALLSGGQTFMVSLALALGLSDMTDNTRNKVDTLFIDEGFGSLSEDYLTRVMTCLSSLHQHTGKHVGIISHVELLRQNIPNRIELEGGVGVAPSTLRVVPSV